VTLSGDAQQTISFEDTFTSRFFNLSVTNESDEGVLFFTSLTVSRLFNHNQLPFVLNNGGTFPDFDGDGYKDNIDTFPLDAEQFELDTDKDGIADNLDLDDDGDGIPDVWELTYSLNPLDSSDAASDFDQDTLSNLDEFLAGTLPSDNDSDDDGITDQFDSEPLNVLVGDSASPTIATLETLTMEATGVTTNVTLVAPTVTDNNINLPSIMSNYDAPLTVGSHQITWIATDFVGNTSTATQTVNIIDTTAPIFGEVSAITINATGINTSISSAINFIATDSVDGDITATITSETELISGQHTVNLEATDANENKAAAKLIVNINPLVVILATAQVEANQTYDYNVKLSGEAAVYPVTVSYQITDDENVYQIEFEEGVEQSISVAIPNEAINGDELVVSLISAENAVISDSDTLLLTVFEENIAPTSTIQIVQNNLPISVVDAKQGNVTVTVNINDVNAADTYTVTWQSNNNELDDLDADGLPNTFEFSPSNLEGSVELSVVVTENNTVELFSISLTESVIVKSSLPLLSNVADSDNDGTLDIDEGYQDSDGDGISDYLDNDADTTRLPIADNSAPIQTAVHLKLSIGDIVKDSNGVESKGAAITTDDIATHLGNIQVGDNSDDSHFEAIIPLINFNVEGLQEVGGIVPVIIPLPDNKIIPDNAVYRKYIVENGWFDFVEDGNNTISSAIKDSNGNCPIPLSSSYQSGLNVGDNCIQLLIEDGGANDADGLANSIVKDPGVLAVTKVNELPIITVNASINVEENTNVSIEATATDAENDNIIYLWQQTNGDEVQIADTSSSALVFNAPSVNREGSTLVFNLTVDDGFGEAKSEVTVNVLNVNQAPVVSIPSISNYDEGDTVTITISAVDSDDDLLSYQWLQTSGTSAQLSDSTISTLSFVAPEISEDSNLVFELTVSDGIINTQESITIQVNNVPDTVTPEPSVKESSSGGGSISWLMLLISLGLCRRQRRLLKAA
jgi:hypothetical protein